MVEVGIKNPTELQRALLNYGEARIAGLGKTLASPPFAHRPLPPCRGAKVTAPGFPSAAFPATLAILATRIKAAKPSAGLPRP
eukprot:gene3348-3845_t